MVWHSTTALVLVAILAVIQLDVCSGQTLASLGVADVNGLTESICVNDGSNERGTGRVVDGVDSACSLCGWDADLQPAFCVQRLGGAYRGASNECAFRQLTVCVESVVNFDANTNKRLCCGTSSAARTCTTNEENNVCCNDGDCSILGGGTCEFREASGGNTCIGGSPPDFDDDY